MEDNNENQPNGKLNKNKTQEYCHGYYDLLESYIDAGLLEALKYENERLVRAEYNSPYGST